MTNKPADPKAKVAPAHPGMLGDGTEEQNLNQKGDPSARIKQEDVDAAGNPPEPDMEDGHQRDRDTAQAVKVMAIRHRCGRDGRQWRCNWRRRRPEQG